jgi:hypothetical protein
MAGATLATAARRTARFSCRRLPPYAAEQLRVAGVAGTMQPPKFHRSEGGSRRTECGHDPRAESVPIVPAQIHPLIRTAANPGARCSETEIERDVPTRESGPQAACPEPVEGSPRAGSLRSARCRPQDGKPGGAAHFPTRRFTRLISVVAVLERHLKLWWVTTPRFPR